jgi:hypothetical protein
VSAAILPSDPGIMRLLRLVRAETRARNMVEDLEVCRRPWGSTPADVRVHVEPGAGHCFFGRRVAEIVGSLLRAGA